MSTRRVAIVGSGPVGLDAALAAVARGWQAVVYESGPAVASGVRVWGHVELFTPWPMNVSDRMRDVLGAASPDLEQDPRLPTGAELVSRLLEPLARAPELGGSVRAGTRVLGIGRAGLVKDEEIGSRERAARPFLLLVEDRDGERIEQADVVIDSSGALSIPNAVGDGGIPAPGERALDHMLQRSIPDVQGQPRAFAGKTTLVVGAGHSAQTAVRDLAGLAPDAGGTRVIWAVRDQDPSWDGVPDDPLPARAELVSDSVALAGGASGVVDVRLGTSVAGLAERDGRTLVTLGKRGMGEELLADRVLALVGAVGDGSLYEQLQVHECYATAAPMSLSAALLGSGSSDCMAHAPPSGDTLKNPEPGFFIIGAKSHGRFGAFLMQTGYAQVDQVMELLAG
jgi:hypothetical protein